MPFEILREFIWETKLDFEFTNLRVTLEGNGICILSFEPTVYPNILSIKLKQLEFTTKPLQVPLTSKDHVNIDTVRLKACSSQILGSAGTLNRDTEEMSLKFILVLDPLEIPELEHFGIRAPLPVTVIEKGRISLSTGKAEIQVESFSVDRGIFKSLRILGAICSQCPTHAELCATAVEVSGKQDGCFEEVLICPGEEAHLYYEYTGDVTSATIDPGVGVIGSSPGNVTVKPTKDTDYRLNVKGSCDRSDSATVRVIEPGDKWMISVSPNVTSGAACSWEIRVPREQVSEDIVLTSITSSDCMCFFGGCGYFPDWTCRKTDLDGTVHIFDISGFPTSPGEMPVVGNWFFTTRPLFCTQDIVNVCFTLTVKCKG